jgi:choline-glycine betaine transporter
MVPLSGSKNIQTITSCDKHPYPNILVCISFIIFLRMNSEKQKSRIKGLERKKRKKRKEKKRKEKKGKEKKRKEKKRSVMLIKCN